MSKLENWSKNIQVARLRKAIIRDWIDYGELDGSDFRPRLVGNHRQHTKGKLVTAVRALDYDDTKWDGRYGHKYYHYNQQLYGKSREITARRLELYLETLEALPDDGARDR